MKLTTTVFLINGGVVESTSEHEDRGRWQADLADGVLSAEQGFMALLDQKSDVMCIIPGRRVDHIVVSEAETGVPA